MTSEVGRRPAPVAPAITGPSLISRVYGFGSIFGKTMRDSRRACPATTYYTSVQLEGVLEPVADPHARAAALQALMEKMQPEGRHVPITAGDPLYKGPVAKLAICRLVPERMIGCYAVRDGAMAALMLYRSSSPELPADPAAELRSRFGDLGWVAPSLLSVVPDDVYYDEVSQVDLPSWHRGKVVLVGDACGAVSLFAGHGASLAMTGAFVLGEELAGGVEGAFERYQARMKPAVEHTQAFGQRFIGWMAPRSRWRISVRDMAFRLSGLPVVRNLIRGSVMPDVDGVLTSA